jgi:hypothetical protein
MEAWLSTSTNQLARRSRNIPFARIDLIKRRPSSYRKTIGEVVYKAMVEILKAPENDRFQFIAEHETDDFIYDPTFFGIERSPDVARAAQQAMLLLFGAAHLVDGVVDDLDGVELVEGDGGDGQALGDAFDEGRAHVDADFLDRLLVAAMRGEIIGKCSDGPGILALGGEQHAGPVDVGKQSDYGVSGLREKPRTKRRDVVVAAPSGGFVQHHLPI